MRLNPDFLTHVTGDYMVLVPVGDAGDKFRGVVRLNRTASFIADKLKDEITRDGLIKALNEEYNGTAEQFERAVDETVLKLRQVGAVIDE